MITFKSIASSSKGNAYTLTSPGAAPLLIEAGLPIRQLRERIGFSLSGYAGCIVSHEHGDHAKGVKDLLKAGVDCWMSSGTAQALDVFGHHRTNLIHTGERHHVGPWGVTAFALAHDAAEPLGFLVSLGDDRLLFVPDTAYIETGFFGVTIAALECNHVGDILDENVRIGRVDASLADRIRRSHMSLEGMIRMLKANDLGRCRQIYLLHLSDANSDEQRMKLEVQAACGIPVEVCQ